jgi:hypothetical protein
MSLFEVVVSGIYIRPTEEDVTDPGRQKRFLIFFGGNICGLQCIDTAMIFFILYGHIA